MNKTAIQNLARINNMSPPPASVAPQQTKPRKKQSYSYDPAGLAAVNDLVELCNGSVRVAGEKLGLNPTLLTQWRNGAGVRTPYARLARLLVKEEKAKRAPKLVLKPHQHTAVVTLSNEHQDDFKSAVESVGGSYTILTYPDKQ